MRIAFADHAVCRGWGSDPWKWVSGLTPAEKEFVKDGGILLVDGCPRSGGGNGTGTTLRRVVCKNGRWVHRLPDDATIAAVEREYV